MEVHVCITSDKTPAEQVISVSEINQTQLFYCCYIFIVVSENYNILLVLPPL